MVGATNSSSGTGVVGYNANTIGVTYGVSGQSYSNSGTGVKGYASATSGTTYGVYGQSDSTTGTGVYGSGSTGVVGAGGGTGVSGSGITGVYGSGTTYGVYGSSSGFGSNSVGVYGSGQHKGVFGTGDTTGVEGSSTNTGVVGVGGGTGVSGSGTNYGVHGSSSGIGVYATGDYTGVLGTGDTVGVHGRATSSGGIGIDGEAYGGEGNYAGYFYGNVEVHGAFTVYGGPKSAAVDTKDYGTRTLYAVESPENWFQDFGTGQLTNGAAVIPIDPVFAETVNLSEDYHVFLTPNGDCALYVENKTPTSFSVRALGGQTCSIPFDYNIVAKRLGYEDVRLAVTNPPPAPEVPTK